MSVNGQVGDPVRVDDRLRQRHEWPGVRDPLVGPVLVVEDLVLAWGVEEVGLVPDQRMRSLVAIAGGVTPWPILRQLLDLVESPGNVAVEPS